MKFVTLANGARDGRLHLVSRDGRRVVPVDKVQTLQEAMDGWATHSSAFEDAYNRLNADTALGQDFDLSDALSPFPRAVQWLDGSAFDTHARLLQQAWGLPVNGLPERPLMYQGLSDRFLAPSEPAVFPSVEDGIDFEGEFGVVLGDVPMGTGAGDTLQYVRLIVLINDWSLRALGPVEMATGFGWLQCKPACTMAPFAVTPDELGEAWKDARVCLPLTIRRNGELFGEARGDEMKFGFDDLIAHAAYSRDLPAGTIIGSGTVANTNYEKVGSSCIAERRAIEQITEGEGKTGFLGPGELVEMSAGSDQTGDVFGTMSQRVEVAAVA